jgi:predicted transcriptional regulator
MSFPLLGFGVYIFWHVVGVKHNVIYVLGIKHTARMKHAQRKKLTEHYSIPVLITLSELQRQILKHVCSTPEANYVSLTRKLHRDRVTILHSLKSLLKYHYIEQKRLKPEYEKSKLTFIPTYKGFGETWPDVTAESIINTNKHDEIVNYVSFVNDVFAKPQLTQVLKPFCRRLAEGYLTDYQLGEDDKRNFIKESFHIAIFGLTNNEDFDSGFLSDRRTIEWLKRSHTTRELKDFKNSLIRRRDNLNKTIVKFPD